MDPRSKPLGPQRFGPPRRAERRRPRRPDRGKENHENAQVCYLCVAFCFVLCIALPLFWLLP